MKIQANEGLILMLQTQLNEVLLLNHLYTNTEIYIDT